MEGKWGGNKRECKVGRLDAGGGGRLGKFSEKSRRLGCREGTTVPSTPTPQNLCQKVVRRMCRGRDSFFRRGGSTLISTSVRGRPGMGTGNLRTWS